MIIDAHHHFWQYSPEQYGWISGLMARLRRDFLPPDLLAEARAAGVDGVVSVQARQSLEETRWLLDLASRDAFIRGVVGWVPLVSERVADDLATFRGQTKLKAVRHVLQDEPDDDYMLRDDFNRGVTLLKRLDLRYDILIYERHLPQAIQFVDRHPGQTFILDHIAKPRIRDRQLRPWSENLRELARRENVYCKLSGVPTEADHQNWAVADLLPYLTAALDAFGPRRLMFGSDWPVCLLAVEYARWCQLIQDFIAPLTPFEQSRIMGETAVEAYAL